MTTHLLIHRSLLLLVLLLSACQSPEPADHIELPVLFSDHMVIQRNAIVTVWGKATPGKQVTVLFNNQRSSATARSDSSWQLYLAPEEAGGPYTLQVVGSDTLKINDVLVGEVWIGSGQSNMQWSVAQSNNALSEIQNANFPNIRLFSVDRTYNAKPQTQIPSSGWKRTSPETIKSFSAVAYYFGRTLHDSLDVPIGLIHSSWGGTPVEAWTSAVTLKDHPDFSEQIAQLDTLDQNLDSIHSEFPKAMDTWINATSNKDKGYIQGEAAWASPEYDHQSWSSILVPQPWEEVEPGFDGVFWFRKTIELDEAWNDAEASLYLSTIDDIDITWVNGIEVGRTYRYNENRIYTVPAALLKPGKNVITVRVLDTGGNGGFYGSAEEMRLVSKNDSNREVFLTGNWYASIGFNLNDIEEPPPRPRPLQHTPSVLYNAMIHPLIPFRIQGFIWYQGESNANRAHQYKNLFPALITDWRLRWNANTAFYFVQLANFQAQQKNPVESETWPELREAQRAALSLSNTGMAVAIDIGEADDIHPRNKQDVGYRLALNALFSTYNRPIVPAGPLFKSMSIAQDTITLEFDYAENGLKTSDGSPPSGFAVAGEDKVFYRANAAIKNDKVVLRSDNVKTPVAVRYGWANNPVVNLYNMEGLPASPFGTDDWLWITEGNK